MDKAYVEERLKKARKFINQALRELHSEEPPPPPPPPPPPSLAVGGAVSATFQEWEARPEMAGKQLHLMRTFFPGALDTWDNLRDDTQYPRRFLYDFPTRNMQLSFKNTSDNVNVLAGFFETFPDNPDQTIHVIREHEADQPSKNISAARYGEMQQAWVEGTERANQNRTTPIVPVAVLTGWGLVPQYGGTGRLAYMDAIRDLLQSGRLLFGFDPYEALMAGDNRTEPASLIGDIVDVIRLYGASQWGLSEWAPNPNRNSQDKARWIREMLDYLIAEGASWGLYWNYGGTQLDGNGYQAIADYLVS